MAARNDSGAERKSGKLRMRSSMSKGMPWMVEAVRGEGRTGLEGFVSELKVLMSDRASGTGGALVLLAKVVPPAPDRRNRILLRYHEHAAVRAGFGGVGSTSFPGSIFLWHAHLSGFGSTDHSGVLNLIR